jgi:hypothetical protein
MRLTATRTTTSLVASAALAAGMLAMGAGTTASAQPVSGLSAAGRPAPIAGHDASTTATAPAAVAPGDVRAWETAHDDAGLASRILPGDVRVWDLRHSTPS